MKVRLAFNDEFNTFVTRVERPIRSSRARCRSLALLRMTDFPTRCTELQRGNFLSTFDVDR